VRKDAAQGETRSLGFFHQPEGQFEGLLGLPIIGGGQGAGRRLRHKSAALLYTCAARRCPSANWARWNPARWGQPTAAGLWG